MKSNRLTVTLTPEARALFVNEPVGALMYGDAHFDCVSVEDQGQFFRMTINQQDEKSRAAGTPLVAVLRIQKNYVMYVMEEHSDDTQAGFVG